MLSIDLTIDEHTRSITHKLYFKDKTVSVSFFCFTTEVFKQNERLIESMGESITLFDPKREWTKRDSNRVATTFRDEWLGIEIRMLFPFTPSEKGKTTVLNAFSRFDELDCTLLIKQEFADKNQQYMDEFMQHANPKDLLMQNHISEENELTWCMRNSVQQDDDSRFVGRVFLGGFVDRASYGYSHLSLTENELKHYEDVGLLWDMLGGSFPLSKYLPTTERSK